MTEKSATYIYKILPFDKAVKIFTSNSLYFSHPSEWEDPFETVVNHAAIQTTFAQCWCAKGVSDAMWRIYSPHGTGVRLRVNKKEYVKQVKAGAKSLGAKLFTKQVKYVPESLLKEKLQALASSRPADPVKNAITPLFYKRLAYSHEKEFRAVVCGAGRDVSDTHKGIFIPINANSLIETVLVDPRAPDELFSAYAKYLEKELRYSGGVRKSSLYKEASKYDF